MSNSNRSPASVEPEVLAYYQRNAERIIRCYDLGADGLPIDPAWYRRRLYNQFLDREKPHRVLDVGSGAGQTVLDVRARGGDGYGIEPTPALVEAAQRLMEEHGHSRDNIRQGDLSSLANLELQPFDAIALLSVLPAIPREAWFAAHTNIVRNLKPGGVFVAAYRNQLFDLYTFNSFTIDFYDGVLWDTAATPGLASEATVAKLKTLVSNPDVPGAFHTNSPDKAFGRLQRPKSNPFTLPAYLSKFGLQVERMRFCHFHCVPPLMQDAVPEFYRVNHEMELELADDWRGNFMAAMVFVEARKT